MSNQIKVEIEINSSIIGELEYLARLNTVDNEMPYSGYKEIIVQILCSFADGSRRPGSWERSMLEMMGLAVNSAEGREYRRDYGIPTWSKVYKGIEDEQFISETDE